MADSQPASLYSLSLAAGVETLHDRGTGLTGEGVHLEVGLDAGDNAGAGTLRKSSPLVVDFWYNVSGSRMAAER